MLKLKEFKNQLYLFFRVLTETDAYIDVAHKGHVYRIEITDLEYDVPRRKSKKKSLKREISKAKCSTCGGLEINGICMAAAAHPKSD